MEHEGQTVKTKIWKRYLAIGISVAVLLGIIGGAVYFLALRHTSLVPKTVSQQVNFPVFYPDPKKLPAGYTLDTNSFQAPNRLAVIYTVSYGSNKKLVFSVQEKPSDSEIGLFYKNNMPLRTDTLTLVGKAAIGAIGKQTIASLPTNDKSWILVTAPSDTDQSKLADVLQAVKKSEN